VSRQGFKPDSSLIKVRNVVTYVNVLVARHYEITTKILRRYSQCPDRDSNLTAP